MPSQLPLIKEQDMSQECSAIPTTSFQRTGQITGVQCHPNYLWSMYKTCHRSAVPSQFTSLNHDSSEYSAIPIPQEENDTDLGCYPNIKDHMAGHTGAVLSQYVL